MGDIVNTNIRSYPSETNGYIDITTVLVEGAIGDFAVYIGIGSPEWIAKKGVKLHFEEARLHFPFIEEKNYRS
jgi:hypothetical protein